MNSAESAPSPARPRTAADLMDPNPPTVSPFAKVGHVARVLLDHRIAGVPVVAETGEFLGLVTQEDVISRHAHVHFPFYLSILGGVIPLAREHRFEEDMRRIVGRTASDVMTDDPPTCDEEAPIEDVASLMATHRLGALIVLRGDKLAGLITAADLVRLVVVKESDDAGTTVASPEA